VQIRVLRHRPSAVTGAGGSLGCAGEWGRAAELGRCRRVVAGPSRSRAGGRRSCHSVVLGTWALIPLGGAAVGLWWVDRGMGNGGCGWFVTRCLCRSFLLTLLPCSSVVSHPWETVLHELLQRESFPRAVVLHQQLQHGSPAGSQVLPEKLLQRGLLSMGSQPPSGMSTCSGVGSSMACRVDVCSTVDLCGVVGGQPAPSWTSLSLQSVNITPPWTSHGLQGRQPAPPWSSPLLAGRAPAPPWFHHGLRVGRRLHYGLHHGLRVRCRLHCGPP